jgi:hypothetical protein
LIPSEEIPSKDAFNTGKVALLAHGGVNAKAVWKQSAEGFRASG